MHFSEKDYNKTLADFVASLVFVAFMAIALAVSAPVVIQNMDNVAFLLMAAVVLVAIPLACLWLVLPFSDRLSEARRTRHKGTRFYQTVADFVTNWKEPGYPRMIFNQRGYAVIRKVETNHFEVAYHVAHGVTMLYWLTPESISAITHESGPGVYEYMHLLVSDVEALSQRAAAVKSIVSRVNRSADDQRSDH